MDLSFPIRLSRVPAANLVGHEQETLWRWPRPGQSKRWTTVFLESVSFHTRNFLMSGWRGGRKSLWNRERRKKIHKFLVKRRLLKFITVVGLCFSQMYQLKRSSIAWKSIFNHLEGCSETEQTWWKPHFWQKLKSASLRQPQSRQGAAGFQILGCWI